MRAFRLVVSLVLAAGAARAEGLAVGDWTVRDGTYATASAGSVLYSLTDHPYIVNEGSVEADVTILKRIDASGWAAAGVTIRADEGNLWTLTLVEGPDGLRYTELMERCQDVHQAQSTGLTALAPVEGGLGGTWEYGKAYHLRLSLTRDRVSGQITDVASGQVVARHGWELGDALAVRDGWPTLRVDKVQAQFVDIAVEAAPSGPSGTARSYPQGERGCVGLYLGEDMPGAEMPIGLSGFEDAFRRSGLATVRLSSADLADGASLTFPGLRYLAGDLRRLPAGALLPLKRWMQQGGVPVSLTAPAFGEPYWSGESGWVSWDEYRQQRLLALAADARPFLSWSAEELPRWAHILGGDARAAVLGVDGQAPDGESAVTFVVPHFAGGWWALNRDFGEPPARPGESLVCFWVKGDANTPVLSLELREKDGSRWIAVFPVAEEWQYRVLLPRDFIYYSDNPSKGRGGPGDEVQPTNLAGIQFGISRTHTNAVLVTKAAEHRITVGRMAFARMNEDAHAALNAAIRPELEGVSPGYKLFEIQGAARWEPTGLGRLWGITRSSAARPAYGAVERPQGEGFDRGRWWRWVPLVRATAADGRDLGAPVSLVLSETASFPRCAWVSVGALRARDLRTPEMEAAIAKAAERLASGPMLFEGGADRFLAYPDEAVALGARIVSHAVARASGEVVIRIADARGKRVGPEVRLPVALDPRGMVTAKGAAGPLAAGDYTVVTELIVGGAVTDIIRHPLTVVARLEAPPESAIVRSQGGRLTLDGKPYHALGTNYWVHNLGGTPTDVYWRSWVDPVSYQPSIVEADLAQLEQWGVNAIAAVGAHVDWGADENAPAVRDLLDFMWRCERHHVKVILFIPGVDPRGRGDNIARQVIRSVRHHPALLSYDIAWEPSYGDSRRVYTPQWRDWLVQHYGSFDQAEAALGCSLPRDADGEVDAPSNEWIGKDGPEHAVTAAYRAFMDYQLGVEYRHSAAVIRSEDPWHLIGFRGNSPSWVAAFMPVEQPSVLHFVDWAGPESYDVPAYGQVSPAPFIAGHGLCTRWLHFLSGGKPVFWMEFGMPIYPNGTDWKDSMVRIAPERLQYQVDEGSQFWRMHAESGAAGSFVWWYPGGFRLGENSDVGLVDPNNEPRPAVDALRRLLPKLADGDSRKADAWIEFKPETNSGGWVGEYLRLQSEYARLLAQGKAVDMTTAGVGMTSADCPLIDPAGRPWPGAGPLRYLNGVFERIRIRPAGGEWQELELPTAPAKPIEVRIPQGKELEIEAWAGNVAEAKWLRRSVVLRIGDTTAPLEADTPFQGSGHFAAARLRSDGRTTLMLQLNAEGRAAFGEVIELALVP